MHWLSKKGVVVGIIYCLGVSVFGVQSKFHEEFLRQHCRISLIWVSASVLSRMYFAKVEHSQSWVVSAPVRPLTLHVQ
eukprot:3976945-Ditylum_brightwellii.AAC.1